MCKLYDFNGHLLVLSRLYTSYAADGVESDIVRLLSFICGCI